MRIIGFSFKLFIHNVYEQASNKTKAAAASSRHVSDTSKRIFGFSFHFIFNFGRFCWVPRSRLIRKILYNVQWILRRVVCCQSFVSFSGFFFILIWLRCCFACRQSIRNRTQAKSNTTTTSGDKNVDFFFAEFRAFKWLRVRRVCVRRFSFIAESLERIQLIYRWQSVYLSNITSI